LPSHRTSLRAARRAGAALAAALAPLFILAGASIPTQQPAAAEPKKQASRTDEPKPFFQKIPSAAFQFELVPIPGSADGKIKPFHMSRHEITWEGFDVYVFSLDAEDKDVPKDTDAVTRPTKPYLPPDRGFGHEGYAVISVTYKIADGYCKWLSQKSGRTYRLPTEDEWEHACRAGGDAKAAYSFGDDASKLGDYAWYEANAEGTPHPVGKKTANAWGLHDMHGNVLEWVTGRDGKPITKGGCYRDEADKLKVIAGALQERSWNASDPQIPKSTWWLSDGSFVGFRIVCEAEAPKEEKK
jgi:formylglycine-generating enzyme required for sulfatase activity